MSWAPSLILHLCLVLVITYPTAHELWQVFLTHAQSASWFPLPFPPPFTAPYMDGLDVHTSPQLQTHPWCYIRAMQRFTNQIIIATGHTLREDRGQWSNMANQRTDACINLDRENSGKPFLSGCSSNQSAADAYLAFRYWSVCTQQVV